MEERLRTARILASDDEEDEEHVARRRRTRTQIERDLNNPKVHKRIVENLYFAYKMRVRRRRRRRRLAFSLEFSSPKTKPFQKLSMCSRVHWGVGFERSRPPLPFPSNDSVGRLSSFPRRTTGGATIGCPPSPRARAPRSIDRRRLPPVERERERTTWKDPRDLSRWGKGRDRQTFLFLTWQIFFSSCGTLCVCVCVLEN